MHACPPGHFGFAATVKVESLAGRLAEENPDVMPEDDAAGMPVLYGR